MTQTATSQTLPQIQSLLDERLPKILENANQVGNGGIVLKDGEVIALSTAGHRQKDETAQIQSTDKWHIGSITKSITATMIARLADQNVMGFNDTIEQLLPQYVNDIDPAWHKVRVIDLLNHISGADANFGIKILLKRNFESQEQLDQARWEAVLNTLKNPPKYPQGTKFEYSNIGYTIAGTIAAHITGKSWEQLVKQEVFDPLELKSAGFGPPTGANPWGHAKQLWLFTKAMDPTGEDADNTPIMGPAGTIHMSLMDLATYANAHLQAFQGNHSFIKKPSASHLYKIPELTIETERYAAGWAYVPLQPPLEGEVIFHNGSNTMWYAFLIFSPAHNTVIAFATNTGTIMKSENQFHAACEQNIELDKIKEGIMPSFFNLT